MAAAEAEAAPAPEASGSYTGAGGLSTGRKLVPWSSWKEWRFVRDGLFSPFPAAALRRIAAWRSRGSHLIPVDVTAAFVEIRLRDPFFRNGLPGDDAMESDEMLAMLYSMAMMSRSHLSPTLSTTVRISRRRRRVRVPRRRRRFQSSAQRTSLAAFVGGRRLEKQCAARNQGRWRCSHRPVGRMPTVLRGKAEGPPPYEAKKLVANTQAQLQREAEEAAQQAASVNLEAAQEDVSNQPVNQVFTQNDIEVANTQGSTITLLDHMLTQETTTTMQSHVFGPLPDSQFIMNNQPVERPQATNTDYMYQGWQEGSSKYEEETTN